MRVDDWVQHFEPDASRHGAADTIGAKRSHMRLWRNTGQTRRMMHLPGL